MWSKYRADIAYTDTQGQQQKIKHAVTSKSNKHLSEEEKQKLKIKAAKQFLSDKIIELKRVGATNCKGSVATRLYARVGYTDAQGIRHDVVRAAESRTDAREKIREILRDLEDGNERAIEAKRMTFADLAKYFDEHYLKPAEYVDGRKVAGVRSNGLGHPYNHATVTATTTVLNHEGRVFSLRAGERARSLSRAALAHCCTCADASARTGFETCLSKKQCGEGYGQGQATNAPD